MSILGGLPSPEEINQRIEEIEAEKKHLKQLLKVVENAGIQAGQEQREAGIQGQDKAVIK